MTPPEPHELELATDVLRRESSASADPTAAAELSRVAHWLANVAQAEVAKAILPQHQVPA